jgi:biopolymer transport protein ExbB/TolQ
MHAVIVILIVLGVLTTLLMYSCVIAAAMVDREIDEWEEYEKFMDYESHTHTSKLP